MRCGDIDACGRCVRRRQPRSAGSRTPAHGIIDAESSNAGVLRDLQPEGGAQPRKRIASRPGFSETRGPAGPALGFWKA